ncbi:MAG: 23S rRNA (uracil(1939)-C(5))-methyltransferase RlmD [Firmicutes bacterium]|nr:23S rRNA (uracil(1939)-C(5))-methyltransferase RlmD [Bacillota bacterium]
MATKGKTKPVKIGGQYQVEITGLGHSGEGVARIDNFTVFVDGGLPGDSAVVTVTDVRKNYGRAKLVDVESPSAGRITPACPVHDTCGGCQFQAFNYQHQLEWKRQRVIDELTRIGGLPQVAVEPVLGMENPYGYRNKSQYPVTKDFLGNIILGFYQRGTHKVVRSPIGCLNDHPLNVKAIRAVETLLNDLQASVYDEGTGKGLFRHVVARTSAATQEVMVVLVTNGEEIPRLEEIITGLQATVPEMVSLNQNINTENTNVIFGPKTKLLWGKPTIEDWIGGLRFQISPRSFFQVNPTQTQVLYRVAKEFAGLTGKERVVDGYCGIGTIALYVADKASQVIGIENVPEAIADAKENAVANGIDNVEFFADQVEDRLPQLIAAGKEPDVVILDPPRRGVDTRALDALVAAKVPRIVYVSCNPSSLARDLGYLHSHGYQVLQVQPVDMFPHTAHVECVTLMSRL